MRETWLSENQRLVSQDNFGFDLAAVEAAAKKHEAIETDIFAYEERVTAVEQVMEDKSSSILLFRIRYKIAMQRTEVHCLFSDPNPQLGIETSPCLQ
jgi:hypothetical protein